ncbi:secreted RxLR effector protein 161-like [Thrips palmi]|uniref:Secreted RxLR effector protein 161-like n=1 Tax=Thrips palmi TaxID=161013 RepID=A0A6P8ZBR1_THRPL|nr:secreted RxLR effector protein 161-like [Thrips palmi]
MSDAAGLSSPLEVGDPDRRPESLRKFNPKQYQEATGCLLYLSNNTRPDLCYAVSKLCQKNQDPTVSDWNDVKHVLRYLVTTKDLKLCYRRTGEVAKVYCDADFAGDLTDRKSRCGYVIMIANCAVSWYSKKQQSCTALSTVEAEYVCMCEITREVVWIKALLDELGVDEIVGSPCVVFCDNQGAIGLAKDADRNVSERSKHIDVQFHYCREMQQLGVVKFQYVKSNENVADIFTKALKGAKQTEMCSKLGMIK